MRAHTIIPSSNNIRSSTSFFSTSYLKKALNQRSNPEEVIIHSNQGSVYTSYAFQGYMTKQNLVSSMSRSGNCWGNAVIESFHSSLKSEAFAYTKHNSLSNSEVNVRVDSYLKYYSEERIQKNKATFRQLNTA